MAFDSVKNLIATVADSTPAQFDGLAHSRGAQRRDSGSTEPLLSFIAREREGLAEDVFAQRLAASLGWPYLDLPKISVPAEARKKLSTKNRLSIFRCCPISADDGQLQIAVADPFDSAMMNARPVRHPGCRSNSAWLPRAKSKRP